MPEISQFKAVQSTDISATRAASILHANRAFSVALCHLFPQFLRISQMPTRDASAAYPKPVESKYSGYQPSAIGDLPCKLIRCAPELSELPLHRLRASLVFYPRCRDFLNAKRHCRWCGHFLGFRGAGHAYRIDGMQNQTWPTVSR